MLKRAMQRLADDLLNDSRFSSIYESPPWGNPNQSKYLNAVAVGETDWKPPAIVNFLKSVERELGREFSTQRNSARSIDLDLVLYGEQSWDSEGVTVPHPRIAERAFVLMPLSELCPEWLVPGSKLKVSELLSKLPASACAECLRVW